MDFGRVLSEGSSFPHKGKNSTVAKKWFFLDLVTTKTWSSCTGLSFLGSLVGCIFQSGLWQNVFPCVTFIPLCKIWTTLYLAWKQYSWKHSLRLCHFYSTLFIYNLTFLEENIFLARTSILVSLSLPIYNHFYLGRKYHSWKSSVVFWENIPACISLFLESVLDARKKLSRLWIRCLWPLAPDIGLLWQCQFELPAGLHIPKAKVIFPRCASSKYRIWNTSYLFWLI